MAGLVMPDGREVVITEEEGVVDVGQLFLAIAQNTASAVRLLDLLVKLECGVLKRAELKKDFLETQAAVLAAQQAQVPTAEEALAAVQAQQAEALTAE